MKNYKITVNGNTYDVSVEEVGAFTGAPAGYAPAPVQAQPKAAQSAPAPSAPTASGAKGSKTVTSPMPGNIFDIKVKVGDKVSANQVVIILEAMKMENEIVTEFAGTVASIEVNEGAAVNSGDVLITIAE